MGKLNPAALEREATVALDTVTLIYFLERHPDHYPTVRALFQGIEVGRLFAVMATLVFTELLVPAFRTGQVEAAAQLVQTLSNFPHLNILPLTSTIAADAARLRARYGIRTPDAIHAATALAGGAGGLVTNDRDLLRLKPELEIWLLE